MQDAMWDGGPNQQAGDGQQPTYSYAPRCGTMA